MPLRVYQRQYIWTEEKGTKTWMIIAAMYTIWAAVKSKPQKILRFEYDLNPWLLWYWCSALPTELSSQLVAVHIVRLKIPFKPQKKGYQFTVIRESKQWPLWYRFMVPSLADTYGYFFLSQGWLLSGHLTISLKRMLAHILVAQIPSATWYQPHPKQRSWQKLNECQAVSGASVSSLECQWLSVHLNKDGDAEVEEAIHQLVMQSSCLVSLASVPWLVSLFAYKVLLLEPWSDQEYQTS